MVHQLKYEALDSKKQAAVNISAPRDRKLKFVTQYLSTLLEQRVTTFKTHLIKEASTEDGATSARLKMLKVAEFLMQDAASKLAL